MLFNLFVVNERPEAMSLQDRELRRQSLLSELKLKIEATERRYQDEQKPKVAAAAEKKEPNTESAGTSEIKLVKAKKSV
jgi:hypothetical protein